LAAVCALTIVGVFLTGLPAWGQLVTNAREPEVPVWQLPAAFFHGSGALGDFDGDHRVDFAVAEPRVLAGRPNSYRVEVRLSGHRISAFDVDMQVPGDLRVAALDIDGDHDLDLIIVTALGRHLVSVWINDGQGVFSQGDLVAYSALIRQENTTFFEAQEPPGQLTALLSCRDDDWTLGKSDGTVSVSSSLRLCYTLQRDLPQRLINPSSPFRAPPLF
jgi:hypothetical protein